MRKPIIFLILPLLTSCNSVSVRADVDFNSLSFSFNEYDSVEIHTDLQKNYLNDNYANIANYASGVEELSRPNTFRLEWSLNDEHGSVTPSYYLLNIYSDDSLNEFKTYKCTSSYQDLTNLEVDKTYYYSVSAVFDNVSIGSKINSFTTSPKGLRNLYVSGVTNARDLGGYTNIFGEKIKQNMVLRMGQLNNSYSLNISPKISENGRKTLIDDFKVKSEIDLREIANNESGSLYDSILGKDVKYYPYHFSWDVENAYKNEVDSLKRVFKVFTNKENYPIVFHCAIGTDRTGVIAFYLNALMGLSDEDIYKDYLFSNFGNIGGSRGLTNIDKHFSNINKYSGNNIREKAYSYFKSIGFTTAELDTIVNLLVE